MGKINWTLPQLDRGVFEVVVEYEKARKAKKTSKETASFLSKSFEKRLKHLGVL